MIRANENAFAAGGGSSSKYQLDAQGQPTSVLSPVPNHSANTGLLHFVERWRVPLESQTTNAQLLEEASLFLHGVDLHDDDGRNLGVGVISIGEAWLTWSSSADDSVLRDVSNSDAASAQLSPLLNQMKIAKTNTTESQQQQQQQQQQHEQLQVQLRFNFSDFEDVSLDWPMEGSPMIVLDTGTRPRLRLAFGCMKDMQDRVIDPYAILDLIIGAAPLQDDLLCPSPPTPSGGGGNVNGRSNARRKSDRRKSILLDGLDLHDFSFDKEEDDMHDDSSPSVERATEEEVGLEHGQLLLSTQTTTAEMIPSASSSNLVRDSEKDSHVTLDISTTENYSGDVQNQAEQSNETDEADGAMDGLDELESPSDKWFQRGSRTETQASRRQSISLDLLPAFDMSYESEEQEQEQEAVGYGQEKAQISKEPQAKDDEEDEQETEKVHNTEVEPGVYDQVSSSSSSCDNRATSATEFGSSPPTTAAENITAVTSVSESACLSSHESTREASMETSSEIEQHQLRGANTRLINQVSESRKHTVASIMSPMVNCDVTDDSEGEPIVDEDRYDIDRSIDNEWKEKIRAYVLHGPLSQEGIDSRLHIHQSYGYELQSEIPCDPAKQYIKGRKPRKAVVRKIVDSVSALQAQTKADLAEVQRVTGLTVVSKSGGYKYRDTVTGESVSPLVFQKRYLLKIGCKLGHGSLPGGLKPPQPSSSDLRSHHHHQQQDSPDTHVSTAAATAAATKHVTNLRTGGEEEREQEEHEQEQEEREQEDEAESPSQHCAAVVQSHEESPHLDDANEIWKVNLPHPKELVNVLDTLPPLVDLPDPVGKGDQILQQELYLLLRQSEIELHSAFDTALAEFEQKRSHATAQYHAKREQFQSVDR